MAEATITLPQRLHAVFSRVYQEDAKDGPWMVWSSILDARPDSAQFLQRLAIIKAGCEKLAQEMSVLPMEDALRQEGTNALRRLMKLTDPQEFSQHPDAWKRAASSQNATSLLSMHYVYLHHAKVTKYETSELAVVLDELKALRSEIKSGDLDQELKEVMVQKLSELVYFLERVDRYGLDAAWAAGAELAGARVRLDRELDEQSPELNEKVTHASKRVFKWLIAAGGVYGGLQAVSAATGVAIDILISPAN